jgi:hypothetical protein
MVELGHMDGSSEGLLSTIKTLYSVVRWPMSKLWPGREGWSADCPKDNVGKCLDPDIAWRDPPNKRWCQMREMRKDDFYSLHIKKPRVITNVEVKTEGDRYPIKWALEIKRTDDSEWEKLCEREGLIEYTFEKPTKFIKLQLKIILPRLAPKGEMKSWCIYDILLTEKRFYGKRVIR